ncbi:MAG: hypothetical protein MZV63_16000 [Marinilabiliales bacterium]|nr:hypothetical protein [Marinilabiliales bacterium]
MACPATPAAIPMNAPPVGHPARRHRRRGRSTAPRRLHRRQPVDAELGGLDDPRLLHRRRRVQGRPVVWCICSFRMRSCCRASGPSTACAPSRRRSDRGRSGARTSSRSRCRCCGRPPTSTASSGPTRASDGLLPFVIKRLARLKPEIEASGHRIRSR